MRLHHLGSNEVNGQATTTGLGAKLFEGCVDGQPSLHRDDSLCLFDDDAGIKRSTKLTNEIGIAFVGHCSTLAVRRNQHRGLDEGVHLRHHQRQLSPVVTTQQSQQSRDAVSHRLRAEEHTLADLLVGHALRNQ